MGAYENASMMHGGNLISRSRRLLQLAQLPDAIEDAIVAV